MSTWSLLFAWISTCWSIKYKIQSSGESSLMSLPCTLHHLLEKGISMQIFSYKSFHKVKRRFCCPLRLGYLDVEITARTHGEASHQTWLFGLKITARTPGECFAYSLLAIWETYLLENGRKVFCEKVRIPFFEISKSRQCRRSLQHLHEQNAKLNPSILPS